MDGVESLTVEGANVDNYWRDTVGIYINRGDTYRPTIIYDTIRDELIIMNWGDFLENMKEENELGR